MKESAPALKILLIRLHAIGDTAITLPACNFIRKNYPGHELHFLTTALPSGLVDSTGIFSRVFKLEKGFEINDTGYSSFSKRFRRLVSSIKTGLKLRKNNYDAVVDLQNNKFSRILRKIVSAKRYSEFENFEERSHSQRVIDAFTKAGLENVKNDFGITLRQEQVNDGKNILLRSGWDGKQKIIMVNPAGLYETRRWGLENYLKLSELLLRNNYAVMISGTEKIKKISAEFKTRLGANPIDIAGITSIREIPGILSHISGAVSDDSGLYHIAWSMGIPGVLLLGSTKSHWTCQPGEHNVCLNSSDLDCGNCMKETCRWGDTRCLKRYEPEYVFSRLVEVMQKQKTNV